jgi:hypothetical protein
VGTDDERRFWVLLTPWTLLTLLHSDASTPPVAETARRSSPCRVIRLSR